LTDGFSHEVSETRRSGVPTLVLFTSQDCAYCNRLKNQVLVPLLERGALKGIARIREIDIHGGGKIRDFDGERIRTKIFVERYDVYATPTLMLVNGRGESVGEPIVGFNNAEDYLPYLESVVEVIGASSQLAGSQAKSLPVAKAESS
jgi:thioredoxin-related protein